MTQINDRTAPADVDELLGQLTLAEKAELCAGADVWRTVAVPRLGIPAVKLTDGPVGVRGASFTTYSSTGFPCGAAIGATFDVALAERLGQALAREAQAKGASVLLGPTVNLHRTPLGGRNFECYSEDPHLTTALAVAYVRAVQAEGVAACIKHFVGNDAEFERRTISSDIDERPLRELYLQPFEAAVQDAGTWAVMSSYNRINGTYASEHEPLLHGVLKGEWGFDGVVVSDWFGTYSTLGAAAGGLDLEMPGPGRRFGPSLEAAVQTGEVDEAAVDDKVRRILTLIERTGGFDRAPEGDEVSTDVAEHRELAATIAASSFVLLRNEPAGSTATNLLPLDRAEVGSLAVIGPNAVAAVSQGGGSSRVLNQETPTPAEALRSLVGDQVDVVVEPGCDNDRDIPLLDLRQLDGPAEVAYHPFGDPDAPPLHVEQHPRLSLAWFGDPPPGVGSATFTVVIRAGLTSRTGGTASLGVTAAGPWRLEVDGALVLEDDGSERGKAFYGFGTPLRQAPVRLEPGRRHELVIRYDRAPRELMAGLKVVCSPPADAGAFDRAVEAARSSDVAVVVVGTNEEWESEGFDRTTLSLPGRQDELVAAVAAANPRTVVVVNAGAPVTMPWLDDVAAVLWAWFPGVQGSVALADVLFGHREPTGRLPTTLPKRIQDTPSYTSDPGDGGHLRYGEGVFVGYRWFDAREIEPAFPFGHGLTYSEVRYDALEVVSQGDGRAARVRLTNVGDRAVTEVVQCYLRRPPKPLSQPTRVLAGFAKVRLEPGEQQEVLVGLDHRTLRSWHPAEGWVVLSGTYGVDIGRSSRDIRLIATFDHAV
jgi:beta-glucosidase